MLSRDTAGAHSRRDQVERSGTQPWFVLAEDGQGIKRRGVELDASSEQNIGTPQVFKARRASAGNSSRGRRY